MKTQALFYLLIPVLFSCNRDPGNHAVMKGGFKQSIIEAGELESIRASFITMPSISWQYGSQYKIIGLVEHGQIVKKGDSIIKLDASSVYKYILESEDRLENELAAAKKQEVQSKNNLQDLGAQLKNELASYDLKKLELERSKFDTEIKKRIKELEFRQAEIRLNKVRRNFELKPVLDNYDKKIQKIKVRQREDDLKNAKATLKQFLIKAPCDGTFQVGTNMFTMNPQIFRVGDSPYRGQLIASIPDIVNMKVKTYINEADITKAKTGTKVIVRLDALPSVPFHGRISAISKICLPRDREKVFNVTVEVEESDIRLKPGMTVSCEYICHETDTCIYVPNNCIYRKDGHTYIFLDKGRTPSKHEITTGPSNSTNTIIQGKIEPGQKLIPVEKVDLKKYS